MSYDYGDSDHWLKRDMIAFQEHCLQKYAEEFAAFRKERRLKRLIEFRDSLAADLAAAQKELEEESKSK